MSPALSLSLSNYASALAMQVSSRHIAEAVLPDPRYYAGSCRPAGRGVVNVERAACTCIERGPVCKPAVIMPACHAPHIACVTYNRLQPILRPDSASRWHRDPVDSKAAALSAGTSLDSGQQKTKFEVQQSASSSREQPGGAVDVR